MDEINKTKIKAIKIDQNQVEKLSESLDNTFAIAESSLVIQENQALAKQSISGDFEEWKASKAIERIKLSKNLENTQNNLQEMLEDSISRVFLGIEDSKEIISPELKAQVGQTKIFETAQHALRLATKKTLMNFDQNVVKVYRLRNQMPLYDAIMKQTNEGIENGVKIAYKNGRQMSFRSYMEMNIRTTVRQESNEYLFEASRANKVVAFVSNYYGDSADDHKDFQNMYFYDEAWRSFGFDEETTKKIEEIIRRNKLISYQDVTQKPPYLTTRPNCRHTLTPVPLQDFLRKSPVQVAEEQGLRKGTYKDKNYKLLQEQRYNERMIRKYKTRLANDIKMQQEMQSPQMEAQIKKDRMLITAWQAKQNKLIKANPFLKRDYRREDTSVVVFDAGARYHKGMDLKTNKIFFTQK